MTIENSPKQLAIIDNNTSNLIKLAGGSEATHRLYQLKDTDPHRDYYLVQDTQGLCSDQYASKGICINKLTLITVKPGQKNQVIVEDIKGDKTARASLDFFFPGRREKIIHLGTAVELGSKIYYQETQDLAVPPKKPSLYTGFNTFTQLLSLYTQLVKPKETLQLKDLSKLNRQLFNFPSFNSSEYADSQATREETQALFDKLEKEFKQGRLLDKLDQIINQYEAGIKKTFKDKRLRALAYAHFADALLNLGVLGFMKFGILLESRYPDVAFIQEIRAYRKKLTDKGSALKKAQEKTIEQIYKDYLSSEKTTAEDFILVQLALDLHSWKQSLPKESYEKFSKKLEADQKAFYENAPKEAGKAILKVQLGGQNFEYKLDKPRF